MITLKTLISGFKNCLYLGLEPEAVCKEDNSNKDEIKKLKETIKDELSSLGENLKSTTLKEKLDKSCSIDELNKLKKEIKVFKFTGKNVEDLKNGTEITIDLGKSPNENFYLSELPEKITSINYNGEVYNRASGSRKGEFISDKFEILQTKDQMKFAINETIRETEVSEKEKKDNESIEKSKSPLDKAILLKIKEKGFNDKILADEVKKGLLSDEEGIISDNFEELNGEEKTKKQKEFNEFMSKKYPGYPDNLSKLNEKIDELLSEYRYNKGAYNTPKKLLEQVSQIKDKDKQEEQVREILQPQIELATKTSPENWSKKVSTENPELEALKGSPIFQLINLFFKGILGVDLFQSLGQDYNEELNDPEKAREKVGSLIGGKESGELGSLSEFFESGGKGPYTINPHDGNGPSFGTYQLHGEMLRSFAQENGIEGNYKENGKETTFAKNWNAKIKEVGEEKFKEKEHEFIKKTHYLPQVEKIKVETGINVDNLSMSIRNAVWSTSVQHGANSEIIVKAIKNLGVNLDYTDLNNQKKLIEKIYEIRTSSFSKNTKRYQKEKFIALQNLNISLADNKGTISDNNGKKINIPKGIISFPKEYSDKGTTLCSRTAYKNLTQVFGVSAETGSSAMEVYNKSKGQTTEKFPPSKGKVADLFMSSLKYPQYGHRAVAFVDNGNWFVLDPYLPASGTYTRNPIPWETYKKYLDNKGRKFFGAKVY